MNKGVGSIHGIDNPTPLRRSDLLAFLFPENAVIGKSSLNADAQISFGFAIGYRYKRVISFAFGHKRSFEVPVSNVSGFGRQSHGEIQQAIEFNLIRNHSLPFRLRLSSSSLTSSNLRR